MRDWDEIARSPRRGIGRLRLVMSPYRTNVR